jgi:protein phosphatase
MQKFRKFARIQAERLLIRAFVLTDTGCVRKNNEDNADFLFMGGGKTDFYAVLADGMGGYERGDAASSIMIDTVRDDNGNTMKRRPRKWLSDMFNKANSIIYNYSKELQSVMGTTGSMLLIRKKKIYCAHIGDSRVYLLSDGKLKQLTTDHTVVGEMLRKGKITAAEADIHPQRNVLTKAIGTKPDVEPDVFRICRTVRAGDRFLLCSDGLHGLVSDDEIRQHLSCKSVRKAAISLVNTAKGYGGYDNVTVIVVEVNDKINICNDEL